MASGSVVGWQVDIPSLTNLVGNLGVEGLKKLQMCGVDIHTLSCLAVLGELTPATIQYRTQLQKRRQKQRAETWWMHSLVEFGCGTNFVVDELLKTRSGENILALLSAVISVYEEPSTEVLNLLFEKQRASPYNTPSITQFDNLRSVCLPLARAMNFKDHLAELHLWLNSEFLGINTFSATNAVPDAKLMAEIVVTLKELSTHNEDSPRKLIFYGICGAAWLLVYSWKILGLNVCLIHKDGRVHPVQGDYESASIIIVPHTENPSEVVHNIGWSANTIISKQPTLATQLNWVVSCADDGVNFFDLCCGFKVDNPQEIGDLIYSIAVEYVQRRITWLHQENRVAGTCLYYELHLETLLAGLREILYLLGLPRHLSFKSDWRGSFISCSPGNDLKHLFSSEGVVFDANNILCWANRPLHLTLPSESRFGHSKSRDPAAQPCVCIWNHLNRVVKNLAYLASSLAFTDWAHGFRKISINMVFQVTNGALGGIQDRYYFSTVYHKTTVNKNIAEMGDRFSLTRLSFVDTLRSILCASVDTQRSTQLQSFDTIGIDLDGLLLIDYRSIETSLKPGPIFILREGEFSLAGDRRQTVTASQYSMRDEPRLPPEEYPSLQPYDGFKDGSLSVSASLTKSTIFLHYSWSGMVRGAKSTLTIDIANICHHISSLLVTAPCQHSFMAPLITRKLERQSHPSIHRWLVDDTSTVWMKMDTFSQITYSVADHNLYISDSVYHLYPTLNNALGQWAALSTIPPQVVHFNILQRGACLSCTRDQAERTWGRGYAGNKAVIVISGDSPEGVGG